VIRKVPRTAARHPDFGQATQHSIVIRNKEQPGNPLSSCSPRNGASCVVLQVMWTSVETSSIDPQAFGLIEGVGAVAAAPKHLREADLWWSHDQSLTTLYPITEGRRRNSKNPLMSTNKTSGHYQLTFHAILVIRIGCRGLGGSFLHLLILICLLLYQSSLYALQAALQAGGPRQGFKIPKSLDIIRGTMDSSSPHQIRAWLQYQPIPYSLSCFTLPPRHGISPQNDTVHLGRGRGGVGTRIKVNSMNY
jgi:hypothetical protein